MEQQPPAMQAPRTFRASRFILFYGAFFGLALGLLAALTVLLATRGRASETDRLVFLVTAIVLAVPALLILIALLRGAFRVTTVPARDGGLLALQLRGIVRRDLIPVDEMRSLDTQRWDVGSLFPVLHHQGGAVRLLAVGEVQALARELIRERPLLDVRIQARPRGARLLGSAIAAVGAFIALVVLVGGGEGRGTLLPAAGMLVVVGLAIAFGTTMTPRPGQAGERLEGALTRIGGRPGAALSQGRRRALLTAIGGVVVFAAFVGLDLLRPPEQAIFRQPWAIGLFVLVVLVLPLSLLSAIRGGIGVVLSPRGLELTGYSIGRVFTPWDRIRDVRLASAISRPVVRIDVDPSARAGWSRAYRVLSWPSRRLTHADLTLAPRIMGVDAQALVAWIDHYRQDPGSRAELGVAGLQRLVAIEAAFPALR